MLQIPCSSKIVSAVFSWKLICKNVYTVYEKAMHKTHASLKVRPGSFITELGVAPLRGSARRRQIKNLYLDGIGGIMKKKKSSIIIIISAM